MLFNHRPQSHAPNRPPAPALTSNSNLSPKRQFGPGPVRLAVGLASMSDLVNTDDLVGVVDHKKDPIISNTKTISVQSGEFFDVMSARINDQRIKSFDNFGSNSFGNRSKTFGNARIDRKLIQQLKDALIFKLTSKKSVRDHFFARSYRMFKIQSVLKIIKMIHDLAVFCQRQKDSFCSSFVVNNELVRLGCHMKSILGFAVERKRGLYVS